MKLIDYPRRFAAMLRRVFSQSQAAVVSSIGRFFYTRPALKRGGLALVLQQLVVLPFCLLAAGSSVGFLDIWVPLVSLLWTIFLVGLFWGMGAERASTDWDDIFALPPLKFFDFWRWHALERKRFTAVLVALIGGLLLVTFVGALS